MVPVKNGKALSFTPGECQHFWNVKLTHGRKAPYSENVGSQELGLGPWRN